MEAVEFIYTDTNFNEIGILKNASIDLEIGKYGVATNDFEITQSLMVWDRAFDIGSIFFFNETEFGGLITSKKVDTSKNQIVLKGTTFRGLLEKEYVQPLSNQAYYIAKGEANSFINDVVSSKFDNLFVVDNIGLSDIEVNYQIRDLNLLEALEKTLARADIASRLDINFYDNQVHLQAIPIVDLSELLQIDNSYNIAMIAQTQTNHFNHVLALGSGELVERLRVNLYLQNNGTWNTQENPNYKGLARNTYFYNNTTEENEIDLIENAIEKVNELNGSDTINVEFSTDECSLFDLIGAKEEITGISFSLPVTKKILKVTIVNEVTNLKVEYKVGDK